MEITENRLARVRSLLDRVEDSNKAYENDKRLGHRIATALEEDGKILWTSYCANCGEILERCPNGNFAEAAGAIHLRANSAHRVLVGYEIILGHKLTQEEIGNLTKKAYG